MAQPVWVLSVDLQTKTATFQSGMADAAKSARGAFNDIKSGSSEMGGHISTNMFASRHAIMAVSEAFGSTMPRAITALLVHIGPLGAALEAAFPFAAIALGAVLVLEHLSKLHEEGIKLTQDQIRFGTAADNAFGMLDQKILQAQIRADDLRNNHLGALHKEIELIDKQSMAELVHQFETVAKAADVVFDDLQSHWYTWGTGSTGAKHALTEFKTEYDALLAKGQEGAAGDLLKGTAESARKILQAQKDAKDSLAAQSGKAGTDIDDQLKYAKATQTLKQAGVGYTEKEMKAQEAIVGALAAQMSIEERMSTLKKQEASNATTATGKEAGQRQAEAARQAAEHAQKMGELTVAAEREAAQVSLAVHAATIDERLALDMKLENESYAVQLKGNADKMAALDKGGKDYANQLKALQDRAEELTREHENAVASLSGKAQEERYRKELTDLEQSEREKINGTQQGSAARLSVIEAAIQEEESRKLQETSFYRELLTQRAEMVRKNAEEEAKLTAEAGMLAAEDQQKMGELRLAAEREQTSLADSARRMTIQQRLDESIRFANEDFAIKAAALTREIAALDKSGKDYENKLREIQNKQKQLVQEHENEITAIKDKAEIDRNQRILAGEQRFNDALASGLAQVLMRHQSFASMMTALGNQVVSGMMQNAIQSMLTLDMDKEKQAAAAARAMFLSGAKLPFPANIVAAPAMAAMAFASVMAFEGGGIVPGVGRGDVVPAMLTPGEGVIPGGVMDGLSRMARSGGMGGGTHYHVTAHFAPTVSALDSDGVEDVLTKHAAKFQRHFENTLRKMNR